MQNPEGLRSCDHFHVAIRHVPTRNGLDLLRPQELQPLGGFVNLGLPDIFPGPRRDPEVAKVILRPTVQLVETFVDLFRRRVHHRKALRLALNFGQPTQAGSADREVCQARGRFDMEVFKLEPRNAVADLDRVFED